MSNRNLVEAQKLGRDLVLANKMPDTFAGDVAPPTSVRGLIFIMLFLGFGLFGGLGWWAQASSIQGAVVATGTFEVDGDLQIVDHLEGGIVEAIFVNEGDFVEAGQPLLQLETSRIEAQTGIIQNQLANALARDARLRAEAAQADDIAFSAELLEYISVEPSFGSVLDAQVALFTSNRDTDAGEVAIYAERIGQLQEQLSGFDNRRDALETQLALVREDLAILEDLLEKGLARTARVIARQEDEVLIIGRLTQTEADRQGVFQQIAEVRQRGLQVPRQRALEIAREQQVVTELVYDLRQRITATDRVLERLTVRAPMAGQVVGLELNTVGESVAQGEEIMRIVPSGKGFVVAAQISTSDVDEVVVGGAVRVRLTAYSFRKTPPVIGEVTHVSADAFLDAATNQNYYRVEVKVPESEFAALPDVQALPGMPVQVLVATGEQTVVNYLLDPVLGGLETAMIEGE